MTPIQIQNSGKVDGKEYISNHVIVIINGL